MPYINGIKQRLLLPMKLIRHFFTLSFLFLIAACTSSPFTELNSRNNFQLEQGSSFKIQVNKDLIPVEMDHNQI